MPQTLARHSTIGVTMDRYTHSARADVAGAVDLLPEAQPDNGTDEASATGTDDLFVPMFAQQGSPDGSHVSARVRDKLAGGSAKKCVNPGKTGV